MVFWKKEKCYDRAVIRFHSPALGPEGTARVAGIRGGRKKFLLPPLQSRPKGHGRRVFFVHLGKTESIYFNTRQLLRLPSSKPVRRVSARTARNNPELRGFAERNHPVPVKAGYDSPGSDDQLRK